MQKAIFILLLTCSLLSCRYNANNNPSADEVRFNFSVSPAFHETAQFSLIKSDTISQLKCIMLDRNGYDKKADTFYSKTIILTKEQFLHFDSAVIQKTKIKQKPQEERCRDGISFQFLVTHNKDTTNLHFGNCPIESDTMGTKIILLSLENLRKLYNDSIITDYFTDVKSYIFDSVKAIQFNENRAINRLRKMEFKRL